MSNSEKLDSCKKEIRSVLIPLQRGCSLTQFHREYKNLIGTRLPSASFGYKTDIDFLFSMPDVVRISNRRGDYHLEAIPDENSLHIQKMVARQKPSKLKGPPPPRYNSRPPRRFDLPPRFMSEARITPEPKLPPKTVTKETKLPSTEPLSIRTQSAAKLSPKEEVVLLVQKHNNKLALDDLLVEYQRMYNKHLSLSTYGLSSIEECVECIPELKIIRKNNVYFIVPGNGVQDSHEETSDRIPTPEAPEYLHQMSNSNSIRNEDYYDGNVPNSLKKKFQEVARQHPNGIWALDFPECFKQVTSDSLDFNSLGYRCLADLIDDVPDIFTRKTVAGSRKDYIIYPAKSEVDGSVFVDHIILNFRKILEGYPEGIKIKDILHVYSINCKDMLHIEDLGFDNLETFLSSIENSIPLRFGFIDGEKSVHLVPSPTNEDFSTPAKASEYKYETSMPFDAIVPDLVKIKPLVLPVDFDFSQYVPVFVSAVAHPGHLYIQFRDDSEHGFKKMSEVMESFYYSDVSESYMMKNIHVKEGAFCVAKWPADNHWYRSQIVSVPSANTVKVHYIDYGTKDTIPTHLLRYMKKVFTGLPIQALRCRLAYVKPPNNQGKWGVQVNKRILSLCTDTPLMAKFERKPGEIYSVILCDTNGKDDVYINDVLLNEGLAEHDVPSNNENIPAVPEPKMPLSYHHGLDPIQALQAQYYLKAFVTVAPSFAQNEHYLALLQQISVYCQTNDNIQQPIMPLMAPVGPPGFYSLPQNLKTYSQTNSNITGITFPGATTLEGSSVISRINTATGGNPVDHMIKAPVERDPYVFSKPTENTTLGSGESDNEIFDDDDDDETFEQYCQQVASSSIRYVKKVMLGDGYKIHIILVDSTAYASSGDISQLLWNNKEADYLFGRLEHEEVDIPAVSLSEDGNEVLFQQLERFNVKGVQNITGSKSSIALFPLKSVIKILNIFGHPSVKIRTRLTEEIASFDPSDTFWQDFSPDVTESEDEDNNASVTDDVKIERLCLYDLLAIKESIMCKKKLLNHQNNSQSDEIHKLENLQKRVLQRINQIKQICEEFK